MIVGLGNMSRTMGTGTGETTTPHSTNLTTNRPSALHGHNALLHPSAGVGENIANCVPHPTVHLLSAALTNSPTIW